MMPAPLRRSTHAIPPNPAPNARNVKSTAASAQSPCAIVAARCLSVVSAFNMGRNANAAAANDNNSPQARFAGRNSV
jgi:hypothetical protein